MIIEDTLCELCDEPCVPWDDRDPDQLSLCALHLQALSIEDMEIDVGIWQEIMEHRLHRLRVPSEGSCQGPWCIGTGSGIPRFNSSLDRWRKIVSLYCTECAVRRWGVRLPCTLPSVLECFSRRRKIIIS